MAITWSDVTTIASVTASVALQTRILAMVNRQVDDNAWGDFADDGKVFLAAHYATIFTGGAGSAAASGPVTSESLGSMSRSYGNLSSTEEGELGRTTYGREYLRLLRIAVLPAHVPD